MKFPSSSLCIITKKVFQNFGKEKIQKPKQPENKSTKQLESCAKAIASPN